MWNVGGGNISEVLFGVEVHLAEMVSVGPFTDEGSITKWTLDRGVCRVPRLIDRPGKRQNGARV